MNQAVKENAERIDKLVRAQYVHEHRCCNRCGIVLTFGNRAQNPDGWYCEFCDRERCYYK